MLQFPAEAAAQNTFSNYGKVSEKDFEPTAFDQAGYEAVILINEKNMYFDQYRGDLMLFSTFHIRIKVLKDGFSDPDFFTVRYSGRHDYECCIGNKCSIYTKSGAKISKTKLKMSATKTYQRDSLESWQTMDLPSLSRGQIIDWEFTVASFDFLMPDICKFNSKYPSVANLLVANFPYFMQYKYDLRGSDTLSIYHTRTDDYVSVNYEERTYVGSTAHNTRPIHFRFNSVLDSFKVFNTVPVDVLPVNERHPLYGTASVRMKAARVTQGIGYTGAYFNAWKSLTHLLYVYADPDKRFLSRHEALHEFSVSGYVVVESQNWERLRKRLYRDPRFWKPLIKFNDFPPSLSHLMDPDEDPDTMRVVRDVMKHVSETYKWNHQYANHLSNGFKGLKLTQSGNSAEINLMLVSYLRHYGVNAVPVLAATSDYGDVDSSYANMQQFNTVLAMVKLGQVSADNREVYLLLDATQPYTGNVSLSPMRKEELMWVVDADRAFFVEYTGDTGDTYNAKKISADD